MQELIPVSNRRSVREKQRQRREARNERREAVLDLIVAGYRYEQVAERCGMSVRTLKREIDRILAKREHELPQRYLSVQLARLDKAMRVVDQAMDQADLRAVPALLQLQAQYDRYEGFWAKLAGVQNLAPDEGQISVTGANFRAWVCFGQEGAGRTRAWRGGIFGPCMPSLSPRN